MKLTIRRVKVVTNTNTCDYIYLYPELTTTFHLLDRDPSMRILAKSGEGIGWVRLIFGREPDEIIDMKGEGVEP